MDFPRTSVLVDAYNIRYTLLAASAKGAKWNMATKKVYSQREIRELEEFINDALFGHQPTPEQKPKRRKRTKEMVRYRWNMREGGLRKVKNE